MTLTVQLAPTSEVPDVRYCWDTDTEILSAAVDATLDLPGAHSALREGLGGPPQAGDGAAGVTGAIEVEGTDGSWLSLELVRGRIGGVQVAVWPNVRRRSGLAPPKEVEHRRVVVASARASTPASMEVDTDLAAESDREERTIHFRMGPSRQTRTVQIARDILIDIDGRDRLAGVWLLEVPPFPADL